MHGINYKDITGEFDIIGTLPDGKYEGVSFMNMAYLLKGLDAYERANGKKHPMEDKCINLIWVKLPTKEAFERLGETRERPVDLQHGRRSSWRRRRAASAPGWRRSRTSSGA